MLDQLDLTEENKKLNFYNTYSLFQQIFRMFWGLSEILGRNAVHLLKNL